MRRYVPVCVWYETNAVSSTPTPGGGGGGGRKWLKMNNPFENITNLDSLRQTVKDTLQKSIEEADDTKHKALNQMIKQINGATAAVYVTPFMIMYVLKQFLSLFLSSFYFLKDQELN